MTYLTLTQQILKFSTMFLHDWAAKYIEIAVDDSIISGYEDNTFKPEQYVTYQELHRMIVSSLGYNLYAEQAGGYLMPLLIQMPFVGKK